MWAAYTALQEPVMGTHFQRAAEKSRRFVCFQNCTREMRAQSRKARKQWIVDLLHEAEVAVNKHDLREVYRSSMLSLRNVGMNPFVV